jgi:hypothetical protein
VLLGAMSTLSATSGVVVGGGYVPIANSNQRKKRRGKFYDFILEPYLRFFGFNL